MHYLQLLVHGWHEQGQDEGKKKNPSMELHLNHNNKVVFDLKLKKVSNLLSYENEIV